MKTIKALIKHNPPQAANCKCPLHSDVVCVAQACCHRCAKAVR